MSNHLDVPCSECGKLLYSNARSLPAGQRTCRTCRSKRRSELGNRPPSGMGLTCEHCHVVFHGFRRTQKFCSIACGNAHRFGGVEVERSVRWRRELAMSGLSKTARDRLLHRFRAQGRVCIYCGGAPETLDHVVPLGLGGTNYEGNLVPACRSCNSRKQMRTVMEWRLGKSRTRPATHLPQPRVAHAVRDAWLPPLPDVKPCAFCREPTANRKYCSDSCAREVNARRSRDRYRLAHGIPVDPLEPVSRRNAA